MTWFGCLSQNSRMACYLQQTLLQASILPHVGCVPRLGQSISAEGKPRGMLIRRERISQTSGSEKSSDHRVFFFEGINQLTKVNDMSFPFTSQSSFERCRRHPAEAVILLVQGECGGFSGEGFEERYSSLGQF